MTVPAGAKVCSAGLHARSSRWSPSAGCGPCNDERALARAIHALAAGVPPIDSRIGRAALARAAPKTRMVGTIGEHLERHPNALVDGDSGAPRALQALISELRTAGVDGLVDPQCLDCGQPRKLGFPVEGGRVCDRCKRRRRPPERCTRCGKLARPVARDEHGGALCSACQSRLFVRAVHRCTLCGINKTYRTRRPVCTQCAERASTDCTTCGLPATVPAAGTAACCARCALAPPAPCHMCGEMTAGRDREDRARCDACYQRPVGTCGRCGRVRAIVRLATGDDPDLCAVCWTGPTFQCEGCGRTRPCRGERRGRMLCNICRPPAPQRCAHCQRQRKVTARWPEGPVCATCYQRALNAKGSCPGCERTRRLLAYPGFPEPVCSDCAGAPPEHVCGRCGDEHAPYRRGLCARCVLHDRLTELFGDVAQRTSIGLDGLFDALCGARSPKDTITWLANTPSAPILGQIARGELPCSHETLDQLASSPALAHLEHLLVATGALPPRDPALARLERWIENFLSVRESEPALRPFAHWIVLRRARASSHNAPLTNGQLTAAKNELTAAGEFLAMLAEHDTPLDGCRQADIDTWLTGAHHNRYRARSFVLWATARKLIPRLDFPAGQRTGRPQAISDDDPAQLAHRLLHAPDITARDRVAALLIVLFAQPVGRVARLTIDDVTITEDAVAIRLGTTPIELPQPLAGHLRDLVTDRRTGAAAAIDEPRWLFHGKAPGRPIHELALSRRLKLIGVDCAAARRSTLLHLAGEIPAAIVAEMLGIHISTATTWAEIAGRPWSDYPSLRDQ